MSEDEKLKNILNYVENNKNNLIRQVNLSFEMLQEDLKKMYENNPSTVNSLGSSLDNKINDKIQTSENYIDQNLLTNIVKKKTKRRHISRKNINIDSNSDSNSDSKSSNGTTNKTSNETSNETTSNEEDVKSINLCENETNNTKATPKSKPKYRELIYEVYQNSDNCKINIDNVMKSLSNHSLASDINLFKSVFLKNKRKKDYPIQYITHKKNGVFTYWKNGEMKQDLKGTKVVDIIVGSIQNSYYDAITKCRNNFDGLNEYVEHQEYVTILNKDTYKNQFLNKLKEIISIKQ